MNQKEHNSELPRHHNGFLYWFGGLGLRLLGGWRIEGKLPDIAKGIISVAPHTSNWDFFVGLFVKFRLGLEVNFLGKHTLFRFPIKGFLTKIGGIPVRRDAAHGVVATMTEAFAQRDKLMLVIAPEGTRKKVTQWKTGFLQIAKHAQVPVIPVAFDYARHVIMIGQPVEVLDDTQQALTTIQAFTNQAAGKVAENA